MGKMRHRSSGPTGLIFLVLWWLHPLECWTHRSVPTLARYSVPFDKSSQGGIFVRYIIRIVTSLTYLLPTSAHYRFVLLFSLFCAPVLLVSILDWAPLSAYPTALPSSATFALSLLKALSFTYLVLLSAYLLTSLPPTVIKRRNYHGLSTSTTPTFWSFRISHHQSPEFLPLPKTRLSQLVRTFLLSKYLNRSMLALFFPFFTSESCSSGTFSASEPIRLGLRLLRN